MAHGQTGSNRRRGFAQAGKLVERQIRAAGETRGFAVSRVLTHWAEIVGADLAALMHPVDVRYGRDGGFGATLTVLCSGARAPLAEMRKDEVRARVNAAYGYNAIARVRVTQTAPQGFAEGQAAFGLAKASVASGPSPALQALATASAAPVGDADLRAALESLALNVLSRTRPAGKDSP